VDENIPTEYGVLEVSVDGAAFTKLFQDSDVRQMVVDTAKRRSKRKELQEEFMQEAWLWLSLAPAGYTLEAYRDIVESAVYCEYRRNWNERKVREAYYHRLALCLR